MTDRDHFAAAALTGLLARRDCYDHELAILAYDMADAMLRERETTNHDAAPAAIASAESVAPQPTAGDRSGNPTSHSGTGGTHRSVEESSRPRRAHNPEIAGANPAAPIDDSATGELGGGVGFSPGSRTGPINRTPERESPRRECEESSLRDVLRPDTKGKAAGGPEHHISDRPQPVRDDVSDRSKPISDERLTALEELSAMDQELELKHGITGNPMIKARHNKESAGAGITDAGPRLRQMNDVLEENERLRGQLAMTERERDSLRVSINNLRDYVAELNAELFAASAAKTDTTPPRNGALSDGPDPDSRVWDTPRTPQPHATPPQGSVQGEHNFRDSRNAIEPVAWAVAGDYGDYAVKLFADKASAVLEADRRGLVGLRPDYVVIPLYRHPQPTLTDEEREAVECELGWIKDRNTKHANTLRKMLERLEGEQ